MSDLLSEQGLREALQEIAPWSRAPDWLGSLAEFIDYVEATDVENRSTREFHERIWDNNPVTSVGMGTVDISGAIDNAEFREWLALESVKPLGNTMEERATRLIAFYDEIVHRLQVFSNRVPRVKIFRVLAALYPRYFTTMAYHRRALDCHRALFGKRKKPHAVRRHLDIQKRIEEVIGPSGEDSRSLAARMTLPWFLFTDYIQPEIEADEEEIVEPSGDISLKPLPAVQRRKGFTSIRGGLETVSNALSFVHDGVAREELADHLRAEMPTYRESSIRTLINILKNELYVIREDDGIFTPTGQGEAFLETNDPSELIPKFLTRTLGVDHIVKALDQESLSSAELVALLKRVNPGWTTDYAPTAMLKWLRDFDLIHQEEGIYSLTETGKSWAQAINWEPEFLDPPESSELDEVSLTQAALDIRSVDLDKLIDTVCHGNAFSSHLVGQLHIGLWAHPRRHFAILAGLSGSGKTLLALQYAKALTDQFTETPESNRFVQAVQPGWFDPAPLFGYINPLVPDKYERPPFLDFLLRAARHPDQAFVVLLDEMNLSHPEQYFAPVLSAMESGETLRLHNEGEFFDGVPSLIPYPSNVAFIGTVNMDETTHGVSDKVLDRAFTLEFWDIDLSAYPKWEAEGLKTSDVGDIRQCLTDLMGCLAPERMHFGWRTVEDVLSYMSLASRSPQFSLVPALDDVVYARVLPKLRGAESSRLYEALDKTISVLRQYGLTRSTKKVESMKNDLRDTGMMRFWR